MIRQARKCPLMLGIGLLLALQFLIAGAQAQTELRGRQYIDWFTKKYLPNLGTYTPDEIVTLREKQEKHDYQGVVQGATKIIGKDPKLFYSPAAASWTKALAYYERGWAKHELGSDDYDIDIDSSAELGNLKAVAVLTPIMLGLFQHGLDPKKSGLLARNTANVLRIGAELGSDEAQFQLGATKWPNPLSEEEQAYWSLLWICGWGHKSPEEIDAMLHELFGRLGPQKLQRAFSEHSPLGRLEPPWQKRLPGRGLIATAYADARLRREYGFNYGKHAPKEHALDTPSTIEMYYLHRAGADFNGRASAFLLVPGDRTFPDPSMVSVPTEKLGDLLSPSDSLSVRCGPLVHFAQIYRIDQRRERVDFVDGLFEFWQPSHNSCVTSFELVPLAHGGYLASVPMREVLPMIQGVITLRDRVPLESPASLPDRYVGISQLQGSDFFQFFHLQQVGEEVQEDGGAVLRFMTGAFQGEILLRVDVDKQHRIESASMTMRREWVGTRRSPNQLATDLLKSFLGAFAPPRDQAAVLPLASTISKNREPAAPASIGNDCLDTNRFKAIFYGEQLGCAAVLPAGRLTAKNTADSYGFEALRVTLDSTWNHP